VNHPIHPSNTLQKMANHPKNTLLTIHPFPGVSPFLNGGLPLKKGDITLRVYASTLFKDAFI